MYTSASGTPAIQPLIGSSPLPPSAEAEGGGGGSDSGRSDSAAGGWASSAAGEAATTGAIPGTLCRLDAGTGDTSIDSGAGVGATKVVRGSGTPGGSGSVVLRQLLWLAMEMSGTSERPRRYLKTMGGQERSQTAIIEWVAYLAAKTSSRSVSELKRASL